MTVALQVIRVMLGVFFVMLGAALMLTFGMVVSNHRNELDDWDFALAKAGMVLFGLGIVAVMW